MASIVTVVGSIGVIKYLTSSFCSLVKKQRAALSFATQHVLPQEFEKWNYFNAGLAGFLCLTCYVRDLERPRQDHMIQIKKYILYFYYLHNKISNETTPP